MVFEMMSRKCGRCPGSVHLGAKGAVVTDKPGRRALAHCPDSLDCGFLVRVATRHGNNGAVGGLEPEPVIGAIDVIKLE